MNCPLISWPVHRRSGTRPHDSRNFFGVSTSPRWSLEHVDSMRSLRQSISPQNTKIWVLKFFFRSLISPSEARSFFETKVERIRISQSWTLSRRASDGFGWICCIFMYIQLFTDDMSDLKNNSVLTNQIERLQSRWTDFRLRVKQLSGTCDTNIPGILEFFVLKRVPSRYQRDEHVIFLYPVWNTLKQRKYRYRHLLAPGKSWQWPVCIVSPMWACDLLHLYLVGCTRVARSWRQSARQVVGKCAEQIFDPCRWEDAQFQMIYWSFQVPWIQTHSFGAAKMENRLSSYQSYESNCAWLPLLHAATWLVRFYISGVTAVSCFTHCRGHGMMTGRSSPWRVMAAICCHVWPGFCRAFSPQKKRGFSPFVAFDDLFGGAV